jgi:hypothetical protein
MRHPVLILGLAVSLAGGCQQHPLTDYRALDQAGMGSDKVEQLKTLNVSDAEIPQLVKAKGANISDDTCVSLVRIAHQHQHPFNSGDSIANLAGAGYSEQQILSIAQDDHIDTFSNEAVTLRLIGLSGATVDFLLNRHLRGLPTLSGANISRLKNTGLTENQIVVRIKEGMTDKQAEAEITRRETIRNHSNVGFVRVTGRKRQ